MYLGQIVSRHEKNQTRGCYRAICATVALSLLMNGCASMSAQPLTNPAESTKFDPPALIVAPARFEPIAEVAPVLRTKDKAASEGAAKGMKAAVGGTGGDPSAILLLPILLPVLLPVGAAIGSAHERSLAASDDILAGGRPVVERAIGQLQLQQRLQEHVVAELHAERVGKSVLVQGDIGPRKPDEHPAYQNLAAPVVLEISVLDLGFSDRFGVFSVKTKDGNDGYVFTLTTKARLIDTGRGAVLDEMKHHYRSDALTPTEWLQANAGSFKHTLDDAVQRSAHDIVLEFFRLYYPPKASVPEDDASHSIPYYVLKPLYPEGRRGGLDLRQVISDRYIKGLGGIDVTPIDDLRPTFRWEPFPRPIDLTQWQGHIDNVSYEIAVYQAEKNRFGSTEHYSAGPLAYQRSGLTTPEHRPEESFVPCGRYAWTVRARFVLDGQTRVTEWTGAYPNYAMSPQPWQARRSMRPCESNPCIDSNKYLLLFRAPAEAVSIECPD